MHTYPPKWQICVECRVGKPMKAGELAIYHMMADDNTNRHTEDKQRKQPTNRRLCRWSYRQTDSKLETKTHLQSHHGL